MYNVVYYTRRSERQPASVFRGKQPVNIRADIDAKIRKLKENGVDVLINTPMVV